MSAKSNILVWLDLEMSGLDTDKDVILEVAVVLTDLELNIVEEGPCIEIHHPDFILNSMDEWNSQTHAKSGLLEKVKASKITESQAEEITLQFLEEWVLPKSSPMCGNSICQDRRFMHRRMPNLEQFFHYRNLDVSTVKELAKYWAPEVSKGIRKANNHMALSDIKESIDELKHYRETFFKF